MKVSAVLAIAAIAVPALGAGVGDFPQCAQKCALDSIKTSSCDISDKACVCADKAYASALTSCVTKGCTADEQATTLKVSQAYCAGDDSTSSSSSSSSATSSATVAAAATTSTKAPTTASPVVAAGTGAPVASTNGTGYAGQGKPQPYTGGADALKAGQWMGFFALLGLVAL